jgi:hypothetical protein
VSFLYVFVTGYGPVQGADNLPRITGVSNTTWAQNYVFIGIW